MIDGFAGLIALGFVATVGFMMVRSFNTRRGGAGAPSDSGASYWFTGNYGGPSNSSNEPDPQRRRQLVRRPVQFVRQLVFFP